MTSGVLLPPHGDRAAIRERLSAIVPLGTPDRVNCVSPAAAASVFTMLHVGAVEGSGRFVAPKHIYRMSDEQAAKTSDPARFQYYGDAMVKGYTPPGKSWYADNSRESIRDDSIRYALIPIGAVFQDTSVATTADGARYALRSDFAALFDPALDGKALEQSIAVWRLKHLSPAQLKRAALLQAGLGAEPDPTGYSVTFPNGETRKLKAGPSSVIAKAVVEQFGPTFLKNPALLWLSESGNKVIARDDLLAKKIGLEIDPSKNLPDVMLVDLGAPDGLLLVFVEVVASDGPVTDQRRADLLALAANAGLDPHHVAFVSAFLDRTAPAFRKHVQRLAWNTFAWLAGEPDKIMPMLDGTGGGAAPLRLFDLLPKG